MNLKTMIVVVAMLSESAFSQGLIETIPDIAEKLMPTAVTIVINDRSGKQMRHGSGFIVSANGEVVTNYHVIQRSSAEQINVLTNQLGRHEVEAIIAVDPESDLALLKTRAQKFPTVALAQSDSLRIGETVIVIGAPVLVDLQNTVSTGIVSQLRTERERTHIQFTAPVSPGNSGGPIFNSKGELVGVVRAGIPFAGERPAQNVNIGIPVRHVRELLANRQNYQAHKSARRAVLDSILVFLEGYVRIPLTNSLQQETVDARMILESAYRQGRHGPDTLKNLQKLIELLHSDTIECANKLRQLFSNGFLNRSVALQEWMAYWVIGLREEMIRIAEEQDLLKKSIRVNLFIADHFIRLGNRDSTIFYLKRARQLDVGKKILGDIGSYYWNVGRIDEAGEVFKGLVASDPRNPEWHMKLALCYYKLGFLDKAMEELSIAFNYKKVARGNIYFYGALFQLNNRNFRNAYELLKELGTTTSLAVVLGRGVTEVLLGLKEDALSTYDELRKVNNPWAESLFILIYGD